MLDYYQSHPEALNGQPKRTIADYVESNGILVPRRFDSLKEAKGSGLPIFARSEHLQEYDGVSGLLFSMGLDRLPVVSSDEELKEQILNFHHSSSVIPEAKRYMADYCELVGLDKNIFEQQVSFSYWEKLGGYNRTIIADSAISQRYHVMAFLYDLSRKSIFDYSIVEKGRIVSNPVHTRRSPLAHDLDSSTLDLIGKYEQVRCLERFDPNNCPIMEFQTFEGKNYFLQYHKGKGFSPAKFSLGRTPLDGEVVAGFVNGATPPEGFVSKVGWYYNDRSNSNFKKRLPLEEDGSFDSGDPILTGLMVRKRDIQMLYEPDTSWELMKVVVDHTPKSTLFKPKVSVIIGTNFERYENEYSKLRHEAMSEGEFPFVTIQTISDGRKAYLKRLD